MNMTGGWYSCGRLAAMALPGMPHTQQGVSYRAQQENWQSAKGRDGAPLARKRSARGGGWEYHSSVLPVAARRAACAITAGMSPSFDVRMAALRAAHGVTTDRALAASLRIDRSAVAQWRRRGVIPVRAWKLPDPAGEARDAFKRLSPSDRRALLLALLAEELGACR